MQACFEITMKVLHVSLPTLEKAYKYSILYKNRIWIKQLSFIWDFYPRICGTGIMPVKCFKVFLNPSLAVSKRLFLD